MRSCSTPGGLVIDSHFQESGGVNLSARTLVTMLGLPPSDAGRPAYRR